MPSPSAFVPLAGRMALAAIFIVSALQKAATSEETVGELVAAGIPAVFHWPIVIVEMLGGLMIAAGYGSRVAALVLAVATITAAFLYHSNFADPNQLNLFLQTIAIAGGLFYIVGYGAGAIALDRIRVVPRPQTRFNDLTDLGRPHGTLMH